MSGAVARWEGDSTRLLRDDGCRVPQWLKAHHPPPPEDTNLSVGISVVLQGFEPQTG
jgi:hypothetical protein